MIRTFIIRLREEVVVIMAMDKEAYLKVIDVMNSAYESGAFTAFT